MIFYKLFFILLYLIKYLKLAVKAWKNMCLSNKSARAHLELSEKSKDSPIMPSSFGKK